MIQCLGGLSPVMDKKLLEIAMESINKQVGNMG